MKISEVNIELVRPQDGLIAFASLVIDESIYLGSIGVMKRINEDSYRLLYPTRKVGDKSFNLYYPITKDVGQIIEEKVAKKLKEVLNKNNGHNNTISSNN